MSDSEERDGRRQRRDSGDDKDDEVNRDIVDSQVPKSENSIGGSLFVSNLSRYKDKVTSI